MLGSSSVWDSDHISNGAQCPRHALCIGPGYDGLASGMMVEVPNGALAAMASENFHAEVQINNCCRRQV